jgi:hypothetical protein
LVLDTGANCTIIKNASLLTELATLPSLTTFGGIGGTISTDQVGQLGDLGNAYLCADAPANIVSFSQVREAGHTVQFTENAPNDMFTITTPRSEYRFVKLTNGLHVCPRPTPLTSLIATVANNERMYTKKDVIKAQDARGLQQHMANPPNSRLISAISHGCIVAPNVLPQTSNAPMLSTSPTPTPCRDAPHTAPHLPSSHHQSHASLTQSTSL